LPSSGVTATVACPVSFPNNAALPRFYDIRPFFAALPDPVRQDQSITVNAGAVLRVLRTHRDRPSAEASETAIQKNQSGKLKPGVQGSGRPVNMNVTLNSRNPRGAGV